MTQAGATLVSHPKFLKLSALLEIGRLRTEAAAVEL